MAAEQFPCDPPAAWTVVRARWKTGLADNVDTCVIREPARPAYLPILRAVDRERARLMKAESLLSCVVIAMQCDGGNGNTDDGRAPYYPDLVGIAREFVNDAINGLDSNELRRSAGIGRRSRRPTDRRVRRAAR